MGYYTAIKILKTTVLYNIHGYQEYNFEWKMQVIEEYLQCYFIVKHFIHKKKMYFRDTANKGISGKCKSQVNDHI